jgi:hydroxymethylbilane synthase
MERLRIGTRRSLLARRQAEIVAEALCGCVGGLQVEIVPIVTRGDRTRGPLGPAGGKGLFTTELERALRGGEVDLAVHSAKDLPVAMAGDLAIAAVSPRADPRDALVSSSGTGVADLPVGARVGTSSLRRSAQLRALRGDVEVVPIRGNIETRLSRALEPGRAALDAVVVAMAALERSGLAQRHAGNIHALAIEEFVPAAGQGLLAVQCMADGAAAALAAGIDDRLAHQSLAAERETLRGLGADCHSCVGVHVWADGPEWRAWAMVAEADGSELMRCALRAGTPQELVSRAIARLRGRRLEPGGG